MCTDLDIECCSIDSRINLLEIGVGRNNASFEDQYGLDQSCYARATFEMANIRLQCTADQVN